MRVSLDFNGDKIKEKQNLRRQRKSLQEDSKISNTSQGNLSRNEKKKFKNNLGKICRKLISDKKRGKGKILLFLFLCFFCLFQVKRKN